MFGYFYQAVQLERVWSRAQKGGCNTPKQTGICMDTVESSGTLKYTAHMFHLHQPSNKLQNNCSIQMSALAPSVYTTSNVCDQAVVYNAGHDCTMMSTGNTIIYNIANNHYYMVQSSHHGEFLV